MNNVLKKLCLLCGVLPLTSCNSMMGWFENQDAIRHEQAVIPVEFLLDEGVGKVNVTLSYSLTNKTHRDFVGDYGRDYAQNLFSFTVSDMVTKSFIYQDLYAINDYQKIYEQNFKRALKKTYARYDMNIYDVRLMNLHKSPKEPDQLYNRPAIEHLNWMRVKE